MNKLLNSSLITVALAVVLYFCFSLYSGGQAVWEALIALPLSVWLYILSLSLLNYLLRYGRWFLYIKETGQFQLDDLSHIKHLGIYTAGFALTMTPGKAGEALRSLYLKQFGIDHQRTLAALFVERIMDLLAVLILAVYGLSLLDSSQAQMGAVLSSLLIVACLVIIKLPLKTMVEWPLIKTLPLRLQNALHFFIALLENANQLLSVKMFFIGLSLGIIAWGLEGYGLHLVMDTYMPMSIASSTSVAVYSIAVLLGAIAFLPGGLGGTEAAMIFMLLKLGFDMPAATAITLICRIATLWFAVILGIMVMAMLSNLGIKPLSQEKL